MAARWAWTHLVWLIRTVSPRTTLWGWGGVCATTSGSSWLSCLEDTNNISWGGGAKIPFQSQASSLSYVARMGHCWAEMNLTGREGLEDALATGCLTGENKSGVQPQTRGWSPSLHPLPHFSLQVPPGAAGAARAPPAWPSGWPAPESRLRRPSWTWHRPGDGCLAPAP